MDDIRRIADLGRIDISDPRTARERKRFAVPFLRSVVCGGSFLKVKRKEMTPFCSASSLD